MVVGAEGVRVVADVSAVGFVDAVRPCSTVGVGALPHRDASDAAMFSMSAFEVLTLPSLPRRSPAEAPVAQALVGVSGVALGQYGAVAIDVDRLDPDAAVDTDLWRDTFTGFRTTLEAAVDQSYSGPVKWQFVGPVTVGVALLRAGAEPDAAFRMATRVVRSHLGSLAAVVREALPGAPQLVVLDEPVLRSMMACDFPIPPDEAIDVISAAMAAVERVATTGVHCCGAIDFAGLVEAGPSVLSLTADRSLIAHAGYLQRFLRNGGRIVWGAVPTEGPIGANAARAAARLESVWSALAERGCDPELLRRQAMISPQCGLGGLDTALAARVCGAVATVADAVRPR